MGAGEGEGVGRADGSPRLKSPSSAQNLSDVEFPPSVKDTRPCPALRYRKHGFPFRSLLEW